MSDDTPNRPIPGALARELSRRGLTQADAERLTKLSRSVLAKVNRGESVSEKTIGVLGRLLDEHQPLAGADALLGIGVVHMEPVPTAPRRDRRPPRTGDERIRRQPPGEAVPA